MKLLSEKASTLRRAVAFVMLTVTFFGMIGDLAFAESVQEEPQYAETILSASPQAVNCIHYDDGLEEVERDGRKGLITNTAEKKFHIYMDINDEFMYDIPEGIPVDVTIEYFDEIKNRAFCLMYDSYNPSPKFMNNNKFWGVSEMVTCLGSGEWKTHTFRLTDLRAINRTNNNADLRVQTWIAGTGEKRGDVVFGSIRVEYGKYASYLELSSVTSQYAGNIFSKDDENINLIFNMTNRAENDGVKGTVSYEVYDRNNTLIFDGSFTEELADGGTRSVPVVFKNPGKNGLYSIKVNTDSSCVSDLSKRKTFETEIWFSVMEDLEIGKGNPFMGVNQMIGMKRRGDRKKVAELASRAGFTYLRDDRPQTEYKNGKWCVTDEFKEMYAMLKSYGIEPVLVIDVPYDGKNWPAAGITWATNNPPDTDEEIASYAQYCADVVSDLKGLVQYFEIFNEYNINIRNGVPSASAENYAKMVKAASTSMKLANPECTIIGIAAAGSTADGTDRGIDTQFTTGVFENGGFEGLDAISAHPYDFRRYFGVDRFISDANYLKNLIEDFGGGKEMWMTEFGWGTAAAGITNQSYTREEQYRHMLLQATLARSYGLYSPTIYYCLLDMESRVEQEHNWGLLHEWTRTDGNAYTAKEAYIAMAAYNGFFGADAEPNGVIKKNSTYAFRYSDDTKSRDVALLISVKEEQKIAIDLGTRTAELYDVFGNKIGDLSSNDGVYQLTVSEEPVYIVGNFTKFDDVDIGFDIDFEDNTAGEVNPYELSGTVTELNGNKVLKLPAESTTYINTEIGLENTGIYELKFSMYPTTKQTLFGYSDFKDKILFAFNNGSTDLRLCYFTSTDSTRNSLYGWKATHTDLYSTAYQTRIINNGPRGKWYNFTVIFDQAARKAILSVDVNGVTFDANNPPPIVIDFGKSGYLKNFSIKTIDDSENEDTCYIDNLSFKRVDGLYDSTGENRIVSISDLKEGMTALFKSRSLNVTNAADKYCCIIGFYKEDGRMANISTGTATITDVANGLVEASFTVPDMTAVSEVKVFLWEDYSTVSPIRALCTPFGNK